MQLGSTQYVWMYGSFNFASMHMQFSLYMAYVNFLYLNVYKFILIDMIKNLLKFYKLKLWHEQIIKNLCIDKFNKILELYLNAFIHKDTPGSGSYT